MTWIKLDDQFPDHPKVAGLSADAFRLYIRGLCYASRMLTDGYVPAALAEQWSERKRSAGDLVYYKLWSEIDTHGFLIHDFTEWNAARTREAVANDRRTAAERQAKSRARHGVTSPEVQPQEVEVEVERETPKIKPIAQAEPERFVEFWAAYPRKVGKIAARTAFRAAVRKASADAVIAGAKRLRDDPNLPDEFHIPHPTSWLHAGRWDDGPLPASNGQVDPISAWRASRG